MFKYRSFFGQTSTIMRLFLIVKITKSCEAQAQNVP